MKYLLLTLTLLFFASGIHAQQKPNSETQEGTSEVLHLDDNSQKSRDYVRHHQNPAAPKGDNVVKVGLLYWISGNIPFYYERRILPWLSVQAGIGLTTRDFVADVVNIFIDAAHDGPSYNYYWNYQIRKSRVGVYASLQPKIYFRQHALSGFYLSPMVEFKRFNYVAEALSSSSFTQQNSEPAFSSNVFTKEHRNAVDFTLNIGWQWLFHPVSLEFAMGAGFRRFWEVRQDIESDPITGQYKNVGRYYDGYRPEFNVALSVGGFF